MVTAGQLIREARLRAGLSQREVGQRLNRPGPQVARWESGAVDPGFAVVQRVLRACGFDLDEGLLPWADEFNRQGGMKAARLVASPLAHVNSVYTPLLATPLPSSNPMSPMGMSS